jgi:hypothetical protein
MTDDIPDINSITTAFSYIMILFSYFLVGFVFLSINVPLLMEVLGGKEYTNLHEVIASGILLKLDNFGGSFSPWWYVFVAFTFGFILNPVSQIISFVFGSMLNFFFKKLERPQDFFTPAQYVKNNYAEFSAWLLRHKPEKLIWEWELFLYNMDWGLSINSFVFFLLTGMLLKSWNLGLLILCLLLTSISLGRSKSMGALHQYCVDEMKRPK